MNHPNQEKIDNEARLVRGTHRQKVIAYFNRADLCTAAQRVGNRRQRRAAQRAASLRLRGRTHVP